MFPPQICASRVARRKVLAAVATGPAGVQLRDSRRSMARSQPATLRVGFESNQTASIVAMESVAAALAAEQPEVQFTFEPSPPGSYLIQLVLQLSTGQAPDVFMLNGSFLGEIASAGFALPLDDFLATWDGWNQISDRFRSGMTWQNKIWGMPHQVDSHFLYYRRDIFEAAGLPAEWQPANADEILDVARQIQSAVPDVIPFALYAGASAGLDTVGRGFVPLLLAYGGDFKDENGLWIVDSCAIRAAMRFYERAYVTEGTVPKEVMTDSAPVETMREALVEGSLAMIHEGSWAFGELLTGKEADSREHIGVALMPSAEGGYVVLGSPGNTLFVNARTDFPELAWQFISALNTMEQQVAINTADPHIPTRLDALKELDGMGDPFLSALVASSEWLRVFDPDPAVREVVTIIQNATGAVASGDAGADEIVAQYASELTRAFGDGNVVAQPCNVEA